ncbi:DUF4844 domain-containing protein [Chitinimonas sp. BJYL2]|uniref:DUF4844 domain-containing protein n=1 Tax=Chitinimonas sp. BJYL2 TaxID=2976696 RepID=UPI0022B2DC48|nr:DUF4844 domain-containing protein [Chitinimonas sp. BJYL2]
MKLFALKIIVALLVIFSLVITAGLTGITFAIWPTSISDHELEISTVTIDKLKKLRLERKFDADQAKFYFGAPNELARAAAQSSVDAVIDILLQTLPSNPRRALVLQTFKSALANFHSAESEERDRLLQYFEQIMIIVGIENSGELFNVWRYGFPYGWFLRT